MKRVTISSIMLFVLCACGGEYDTTEAITSDELPKDEALRILQEEFVGGGCKHRIDNTTNTSEYPEHENQMKHFNNLVDLGYADLREEYDRGDAYYYLLPTEKAKTDYDMNTNDRGGSAYITKEHATEILGISYSQDGNKATVLFNTETIESPFYIIATVGAYDACPLGGTREREVTFVKYDTGWRLKKDND